jgi:hypothetical protein
VKEKRLDGSFSLNATKPLYARRVDTVTDLVIFDGEKNESVRVLLKKRLICFCLLDTRSNLGGCRFLCGLDQCGGGRVDDGGGVFFSRLEAQLLDWRFHFELL